MSTWKSGEVYDEKTKTFYEKDYSVKHVHNIFHCEQPHYRTLFDDEEAESPNTDV